METIIQFIVGVSGDPFSGGLLVMIFSALATFALVVALYFLIFGLYNPVTSRLHNLGGDPKQQNGFIRNSAQHLGNYFVIRERPGEKVGALGYKL